MRRRWSCAAAVVMGPGKGPVGAPDVLLERPKMLLKVCVVKEPRRGLWADSLGGLLSLLADIVRIGLVSRTGNRLICNVDVDLVTWQLRGREILSMTLSCSLQLRIVTGVAVRSVLCRPGLCSLLDFVCRVLCLGGCRPAISLIVVDTASIRGISFCGGSREGVLALYLIEFEGVVARVWV